MSIKRDIAKRIAALKDKGLHALTEGEKAFIKARRSYLKKDDKDFFKKEIDFSVKEVEEEEVELESLKVKELKKLAEDHDIDLGEASKKEDIIKIIANELA